MGFKALLLQISASDWWGASTSATMAGFRLAAAAFFMLNLSSKARAPLSLQIKAKNLVGHAV
jgi:hypothetical protein